MRINRKEPRKEREFERWERMKRGCKSEERVAKINVIVPKCQTCGISILAAL